MLFQADASERVLFPGLLKAKKSSINKDRFRSGEDSTIFTGFNSMNLKFDVATENNTAYNKHAQQNSSREKITKLPTESADPFQVTANRLLSPKGPQPSVSKQEHDNANATLDELRNYMTMLDKHSLHNFMIYDGKTLKDTPEFQSFRRMYQHKWGSISSIIEQIESFLSKYQVKLAIINGPKVFELSKLNLPTIKKEDIYPCLANLEQLSVYFEGDGGAVSNDSLKAAIKIQSFGRGYTARKRIKRMKLLIRSAVLIQSVGRLIIQRSILHTKMQTFLSDAESKWLQNRSMLKHWWSVAVDTAGVDSARDPMKSRTLIFLPSLSIAEYLRLSMENFPAMQNVFITGLYQLADPAVTLIYVCPKHLSGNEIIYHEKLLSLMGISLLPKRLHFITPEMIEKLPDHLPLSLALLCSSVALNKIKYIIKRSRSMSMIIPTTVSWIERRLAYVLNVPVLSADPTVSETLSSRSYAKKVFEESEVSVPIGAHDIFNVDDLLMALSKLMASSINIRRWVIKLNYDYNNESCVILDADKMSIVHALRKEQSDMGEGAGWFSRQVQLSVRKRLLAYLTIDLSRRVKICRKDIYRDWDYFIRMMKQYGAVLEAEPIETIGFVNGLCFIDPSGNIDLSTGMEVYVDSCYQNQGYHFPQRMTPDLALHGATRAVARTLFGKYGLIGYVTVKFQSYWDALDNTPRYTIPTSFSTCLCCSALKFFDAQTLWPGPAIRHVGDVRSRRNSFSNEL